MTDKKTPGPWEAKTFVDNRKHGGDHHTFLITPQRGTYGTMFEEDARLAAAAPDLLNALKAAIDIMEYEGMAFPEGEAAIAKAEGLE